MKKASFLSWLLFFLLLSTNMLAQSKSGADYFKGTWSVLVKGTPNGDATLIATSQGQSAPPVKITVQQQ